MVPKEKRCLSRTASNRGGRLVSSDTKDLTPRGQLTASPESWRSRNNELSLSGTQTPFAMKVLACLDLAGSLVGSTLSRAVRISSLLLFAAPSIVGAGAFDGLRERRDALDGVIQSHSVATSRIANLAIDLRRMVVPADCSPWGHDLLLNVLSCRQALVSASESIALPWRSLKPIYFLHRDGRWEQSNKVVWDALGHGNDSVGSFNLAAVSLGDFARGFAAAFPEHCRQNIDLGASAMAAAIDVAQGLDTGDVYRVRRGATNIAATTTRAATLYALCDVYVPQQQRQQIAEARELTHVRMQGVDLNSLFALGCRRALPFAPYLGLACASGPTDAAIYAVHLALPQRLR